MEFLSDAWFTGYKQVLEKEFSPENTTTKADGRFLELYRKCPDGKDTWILLDFEKGILTECVLGRNAEEMPHDVDFRLFADYQTWVRALSLKDDLSDDIVHGKIEFYGNMVKLQQALKPFVKAVLSMGAVRPDGNVILPRLMRAAANIVDKKIFN